MLKNQFFALAEGMNSQVFQVWVLSFVAFSRTRVFRRKKWIQSAQNTRAQFKSRGIEFDFYMIPGLANWLYSSCFQFFAFHNPINYFQLYRFLRKNQIQYIYCRSYHSAFAALSIRALLNSSVQIQFDPRSLFVEEGVFLRKIKGLSFRLWSSVENVIYRKSNWVSFVSQPFKEMQTKKFQISNSAVIYTHAPVEKFHQKPLAPKGKIRICYVGQLEKKGWHDPEKVFDLVHALQSQLEVSLTIVTHSSHDALTNKAKLYGIKDIEIKAAKNIDQITTILKDMHFGILCYKELDSDTERKLAKTVVASKSGEYLAAGLPMICYHELRGIAELIEEHKLGVTYDFGKEQDVVKDIQRIIEDFDAISERCKRIANEKFSLRNNQKIIEKKIIELCAQSQD